MVSVVESTLDDPRQILAAQQNKARGEAVAAMKADGVEYEERMERLQDVSYPKPLEELLFHAYDALPQVPPVGRRPPAVAEVGHPRHVRTGHDLHGVHVLLRAGAHRGHRAALPGRARTRRWTTPSRTI